MDDIDVLLQLIDKKSRVTPLLGTFVATDGLRAQVDVGGSRISMDTITSYRPEVAESVRVFFIDERPYLVGPAVAPPATGLVVSVAGSIVTLDLGPLLGEKPAPFIGTPPTAGETVRLLWSEGPLVLGVPAALPAVPVAPPAPGGGGAQITREFYAIDSGQFNSRWQNNSVRASDNVSGAWFYGTQIKDTIPDSAVIDSIQMYLPNTRDLGVCRVGVHGYDSMPSGWTGSSSEVDLSPRSGLVDLPLTYGDWFKVNGGGVTVTSGNGDNQWLGTQADGQSGRLVIKYH